MLGSVADPGCLSRILIFTHPGSRIQKEQQKRGVKKLLSYLFCSHKFHKIENYFIFDMLKKSGPVFKELWNFLPKNFSLSSRKKRFGIRDPEKNLFRIPDSGPGVKKAPDPGSATLVLGIRMFLDLPDPDSLSEVPIRLRILPFSHKCLERTEIILDKIEL